MYETDWFRNSGLWGGYSKMPQIPETLNIQPLYTNNMSSLGYQSMSLNESASLPTTDISAEIDESVKRHLGNVGGMTAEAKKYYQKANLANKISSYTNIAQGAINLVDTYTAGRANLRMTNKQLDMQKDLIDLNIKNNESVLTAQFKNAIADLQTVYAAKNVDISSQAVRSEIVGSGEDMGKDIADMQTQGRLQKLAIDFQKSVNKMQQRRSERQALVNFGANVISSTMFLI